MSVTSREVGARPAGSGAELPPEWRTLPHGVATGRYLDAGFARLEHEKLWSHVWQFAARVDEIPEVGDYTTYDIGHRSVLIVRADASTIKAYHNACPHRGTTLGEGAGTFGGGQIMCPFHGWRWDLCGHSRFVLERQEFRGGQLRDSDVALREVRAEVFAGFVFINFDRNAQPFDEFIAPVRHYLEDFATGDMHHYWWKSLDVPSNWKVAQEAFLEAFHVPATHPQLEKGGAEVVRGLREDAEFTHRYVEYETFANGHGRFYGGKKTPMAGHVNERKGDPLEDMANRLQLLVDGLDAMVLQENVDLLRTLRDRLIPDGSTLGAEYVKALYARAAAEQRPMPKPTPEIIGMWGGEVFIFPNLMVLPQAGNNMIYRVRPHGFDPERCIFEILSTRTYPAAVKPPRATVQHVTDLLDPEQVRLIPRQDIGNIPRIQKGLRSRSLRQTWLAENQEKLILNMHQELDRYLEA